MGLHKWGVRQNPYTAILSNLSFQFLPKTKSRQLCPLYRHPSDKWTKIRNSNESTLYAQARTVDIVKTVNLFTTKSKIGLKRHIDTYKIL